MDHHCPWLAACVGLHNYKAFLLFLIYTCLFCWLCFTVSATWVWREVLNDSHFQERLMPVNYILLAAMAGIIGLVLTAFTMWHIYLACKGQTTIESFETTRYLTPLRNSIKQHLRQRNPLGEDGPGIGDQLRQIHANVLPGVTRPEEGEERSSPAQGSLRRNYNDLEVARERERYDDYLDEQDSEKLPNAFDLGWRRNLRHVFGEKLLYWALPICNTTGDGWQWEASPRWLEASQHLAKEREARVRENEAFDRERRGWQNGPIIDFRGSSSRYIKDPHASKQSGQLSTKNFDRKDNGTVDREDTSSDEEGQVDSERRPLARPQSSTANWNELPADFLGGPRTGPVGNRAKSRSHSKHRTTDKER